MMQGLGIDQFFGVNQQCANIALLAFPNLSLEFIERFVAASASDYSWLSACGREVSAIGRESLAATSADAFSISSAFDKDSHAHQRFPPIWPLAQRFPSEYFLSHTLSSAPSSRLI